MFLGNNQETLNKNPPQKIPKIKWQLTFIWPFFLYLHTWDLEGKTGPFICKGKQISRPIAHSSSYIYIYKVFLFTHTPRHFVLGHSRNDWSVWSAFSPINTDSGRYWRPFFVKRNKQLTTKSTRLEVILIELHWLKFSLIKPHFAMSIN